ncbi:hypothetical protein CLPUN_12590 [Clostridium puniceum]|uniref:Uncharacterized protein n=1 Tax=Clostridium puniceum TaxID=29367 RepID=A0A1S8TS37_9CLOT|nr:hypothetical protein [Clostridium puniceum]OOM80593.1 hypothetical protein CLPUN_12590 [Clostridium puniceum]
MGSINKKFVILVDLIRNINILNITLILTIGLSFLKINKYIIFILVMLIAVVLAEITQKTIVKYLGDNKSILQSKVFIFFTVFLNLAFLVYYFLKKDYEMVILLITFFCGYALWRKLMNRKSKD